jgi:outer membrane murein-binding lipoprotein Lpp
MRSRVAILIAAAIIASVLAAGCTSSKQNQSTSQAASHDPVLQAVINDDFQAYNNASWVRTLNPLNQSIQWVNATTATVTYKVGGTNVSLTYSAQYTKFASASDASNYVSSINQG